MKKGKVPLRALLFNDRVNTFKKEKLRIANLKKIASCREFLETIKYPADNLGKNHKNFLASGALLSEPPGRREFAIIIFYTKSSQKFMKSLECDLIILILNDKFR